MNILLSSTIISTITIDVIRPRTSNFFPNRWYPNIVENAIATPPRYEIYPSFPIIIHIAQPISEKSRAPRIPISGLLSWTIAVGLPATKRPSLANELIGCCTKPPFIGCCTKPPLLFIGEYAGCEKPPLIGGRLPFVGGFSSASDWAVEYPVLSGAVAGSIAAIASLPDWEEGSGVPPIAGITFSVWKLFVTGGTGAPPIGTPYTPVLGWGTGWAWLNVCWSFITGCAGLNAGWLLIAGWTGVVCWADTAFSAASSSLCTHILHNCFILPSEAFAKPSPIEELHFAQALL